MPDYRDILITTYVYFTVNFKSIIYVKFTQKFLPTLGTTDRNLVWLFDNMQSLIKQVLLTLFCGRPEISFPSWAELLSTPEWFSPVLREPSFHQLAPSHPHQPLWTGSLVNHLSATKILLIMGYVGGWAGQGSIQTRWSIVWQVTV